MSCRFVVNHMVLFSGLAETKSLILKFYVDWVTTPDERNAKYHHALIDAR
ncbi:hypothetical protein Thi970DRAFT_01768 [Thiorhodovibrio frisius]|uniref:Uncharacterized protein n=1 Tax=Thiorhodovibrio frisius TaxID=631362 RepID=H8Z230_9GAMM|nr:hypothetical protein Thi970DRAFT_01768 [Thiorhodovibrio frisius]WPL24139.1 hypothetical protein Thiofri_04353 [Thiorhodovibrio frisius]